MASKFHNRSEDRTVKVTGFLLKQHIQGVYIERKLCSLFTRVGQVEHVSLSADRNSALVRFVCKDTLAFVVEQEWTLSNERLRVRPVRPTDDQQSSWPGQAHIPALSESVDVDIIEKDSFSSYCDNRSRFWDDVPHEQFTIASPAKRKRRCLKSHSLQGPSSAQKKLPKPKKRPRARKKHKHAYLESFPPLPFGINLSKKCPEVVKVQPENTLRQIFIKGSSTATASVPWPSSARDIYKLVAEKTKVPVELIHMTAGGHTLTDEVVRNIGADATIHYTVKGLAGADCQSKDGDSQEQKRRSDASDLKDKGNEMYKKKEFEGAVSYYSASISVFPLVPAYNNRAQCYLSLSEWEKCIDDCSYVLQKEPQNMKAILRRGQAQKEKGDLDSARKDLIVVLGCGFVNLVKKAEDLLADIGKEVSMQKAEAREANETSKLKSDEQLEANGAPDKLSKSARRRLRKKAEKALVVPATSPTKLRSEEAEEQETISTTSAQSRFKEETHSVGQPPSCEQPSMEVTVTVERTIQPSSTEHDVKLWLQYICELTEETISTFQGIGGKVLFAYESDVEKLSKHSEVPVGIARKVIFLRDNPYCQSAMMKWDVKNVVDFIEGFAQGQNLSKLTEKQIDGPAFLSYNTEQELKVDFNIKERVAFQILVERNSFLEGEKNSQSSDNRTCEKGVEELVNTLQLERKERVEEIPETERCKGGISSGLVTSELKEKESETGLIVSLERENVFTEFKLFLQNKLNLQPLHDVKGEMKLKECDLQVIYHKRKDLNKLEEQFVFLIVCKPELCRGKAGKDAYSKLWKVIRENVPSKWVQMLPDNIRKQFTFEKDGERIQYCQANISFGDETAKVMSITEFQKIHPLEKFSTPVILVDKQLLEEGAAGYCFSLKVNKKTDNFCFGFNAELRHWCFDTEDFGWGFQCECLEKSKTGSWPRCHFTAPDFHADDDSPGSFVNPPSENTENPRATTPDTDEKTTHAEEESEKTKKESTEDEKTEEDSLSVAPATLEYVSCRPYKTEHWKYKEGILRAVESGDNMLSPAIEFKLHSSVYCPAGSPSGLRAFLYKSLEFICGCLNARKNGTIYFGIAEKTVKDISFVYGEIHGVEMDQKLCAEYYDLFYNVFLQKCFPDFFEIVKLCISGPHFVHIRNTTTNFVIEIDVEPNFEQTQRHVFEFDPKPIFEKYGQPGKSEKDSSGEKKMKHVYMKNQDTWTGIFRRDGSETKYIDKSQKQQFVCAVLPDLYTKREQEEKWKELTRSQLLNSPEAEDLKLFMEECDASMFPILVLPKLSANEKCNMEYFSFLHHIRWSAVFDFDSDSEKNGVYSMAKSANLAFEVHESVVSDFVDMSVEDRKDSISFPKKTVWLFANGKSTGTNTFDRLAHKAWKNSYWTYIQNAVAFYKDNSVIPPERRLVLILVSDEMDDGILEASQDIKTAFGWESVLFVFNSMSARTIFAEELSEDVLQNSVVLPWRHMHHVLCQCLNLKGHEKDKYVCASSGAHVPIPLNEWQSWNDLDVLNIRECLEEWEGLSKQKKDEKAQEEEEKFYQGKPVSWWNFFLTDFSYDHVMSRTVLHSVMSHIDDKIRSTSKEDDRVPIVTLSHMPAAGGTTLGKYILWKMKEKYKCAVIKNITVDTEREVTQYWESVEEGQDKVQLLPVILLTDNLTNDSSPFNEFELCRRLYRRQKELQLGRPLAILIHCHRNVKPDGKFMLTQKLTPAERSWMEKKSESLEEEHVENLETFIAFLSMRHEFDQEFLQNTITQFLDKNVLYENELALIEYISLITSYFPLSEGSPGLPVTCCDGLMRRFGDDTSRNRTWEKTLSKVAKVLLVVEYRYESQNPRFVVRIANQPYAKVILDTVLKQNNETLGRIVLRCLKSSLVNNSSPSCKDVVEIMSKMLIERHFDEVSTQMTQMSPLIMDIKAKDFEMAVEVLSVGYEKLKNEGFNQQIARLYMSENLLDKAKDFAQLAVKLSPEKRDFKHTLGLVHLKMFLLYVNRGQHLFIHREHLKDAFLALTNFMEAQGRADNDALSICYAHYQTIEVVNKILYFLLDHLPEEEHVILGRYLTEDDFIDFPVFQDLLDQERDTLKSILTHGVRALSFLFYLAYSHGFGRSGVSYQVIRDMRSMENVTKNCPKEMGTLASCISKLRIQHTFTTSHENTRLEDNARRWITVKLKGCFFESIFYQFKYLRGKKWEKERTLRMFQDIKTNVDEIFEKSFTDMDILMTVNLAIQLAEDCQKKPFTENRSQIYKMCDKLLRSDLEPYDTRRMRAHLYRLLVSWPDVYWEGFSEDDFRKSFHVRSPPLIHKKEPLLPKVHFFVTNNLQKFHLCHWTKIYGEVEKEAPWAEMRKFLRSFVGKYKVKKKPNGDQFSSIEMHWKSAAGELNLTIWKIRGEKVFRNERVEFYLGFCLQGPVAFIHNVLSDAEDDLNWQ